MQRIQARDSSHVWMYAPFALAGPLSILGLIDSISKGTASVPSVLVSFFLAVMAALAIYGFAHGTAESELEYWTGEFREILNLRWTDHYASTDPVPNGALIDKAYPEPVASSMGISHHRPHVVLAERRRVHCIAGSLARETDRGSIASGSSAPLGPRMQRAVELRRLRVLYLSCARWLMLVAGAVAVATHPEEWSLLTEWARQKVASWAVAVLPSELSWPVEVTAKPTPAIVAETVGWLAALAAIHYLVL